MLGAPAFAQSISPRPKPTLSNHYAVVLSEPAVLDRFPTRGAARSAAAQSYRMQIEARQQSMKTELATRGFQVTGSVSTSWNAIFVTTVPQRVGELQNLPDVTAVIRMRMMRPNLDRATVLMNAPAAWTALGGQANAGKGIKVAVLDTGIDQTHPAFQDSTLTMPPGFPLCTANHPEDCAYTNSKVIVAKSYVRDMAAPTNATNPAADSLPDDYSPRDRDGHGTAVASAIGAVQNTGPAASFSGIAPKVYLGNYKVYGDVLGTSEDIWVQALNDAFNDGFDIANISSGVIATSGPLDTGAACGLAAGAQNYCDPIAASFEKVAQGGMVVVASAGNDGYNSGSGQFPTYSLVSSPSNAPSVISVGGTLNNHVLLPSVSVTAGPSNLQSIAAQTSDSYWSSGIISPTSAPLVDASAVGDGYACSALPAYSMYVGQTPAYALIERGPAGSGACSFNVKAANAVAAGAAGIIFYMYDSSAPITVELQDSSGNLPISGPVVMIDNSDGLALKSYVAAHPGAVVQIDPNGTETGLTAYNSQWSFSPALAGNMFIGFSSPGPNTGDLAIKPDIVATAGGDPMYLEPLDSNDVNLGGQSGMYLAAQSYDPGGELYSPNRYIAADGTSFAAPLVAGAAALVWQMHPKYTAAQVRSALINSSALDTTTDVYGNPVNAIQIGAGRLDAGAAVAATVAASPVSISFGNLKTATLPISKAITLTNLGAAAVNLTIAVSQPVDINAVTATGATVAVDKSSLSLAAGASGTINVSLSGSAPAPQQYAGAVSVTGTGVSLHIPYIALVPDGVTFDVIPIQNASVSTFYSCFEGTAGQDLGPIGLKVIDDYGLPIVGTPVQFSVSPRGSVSLGSVQYEPACAAGSSATTCNTDNYGIAYAEVTAGSALTSSATITARAGGLSFEYGFDNVGNNCGQVLAAPAITSVVDAAAFTTDITPGAYMTIYGSNLVNPLSVTTDPQCPGGNCAQYLPLPLILDYASVSFDAPPGTAGAWDGKPIDYNGSPGYLTYVSANQLNLQIPWELQGQSSVQMKVIVDGFLTSNVVTIPLVQYSPQLFQSCNGACAIDSTTYAAHPSAVSSTNPAHAGDLVELYANGLGPVTNQPKSGAGAPATNLAQTQSSPAVTIGGQTAQVQFSGLAPGFPGLYQINVYVPSGLAAGNQPVVISIGGQRSKPAMLPVQ